MAKRFKRPIGNKPHKKLFIISTEGTKTEPEYFQHFNSEAVIQVKPLKGDNKTSPKAVLQRMERHLKNECLRKSDEAWLVIDKDEWTDDQLLDLHTWSKNNKKYGLAVSNPKFEYWLLLHFEEGTKIKSITEVTERLKRKIPNYEKSINMKKINRAMIDKAIERAKKIDTPKCEKWPATWGSTVYRLVEKILD